MFDCDTQLIATGLVTVGNRGGWVIIIISQTDLFLVKLSSKTYVSEDNWTKY